MQPLAYRKYRTCERKKVYPSMEAGWGAVANIQSNGNDAFPDFELRPYTCDFCDKIHIGHSNRPRSSESRLRSEAISEAFRVHAEVMAQSNRSSVQTICGS